MRSWLGVIFVDRQLSVIDVVCTALALVEAMLLLAVALYVTSSVPSIVPRLLTSLRA